MNEKRTRRARRERAERIQAVTELFGLFLTGVGFMVLVGMLGKVKIGIPVETLYRVILVVYGVMALLWVAGVVYAEVKVRHRERVKPQREREEVRTPVLVRKVGG